MTLALLTMLLLPIGPDKADLQFSFSVEQWVMQAAPSTPIPQPYRNLIDNLGGDFWRNREAASAVLEHRIGSNYRWLFWGRKQRGAEIRMRSNNLLRKVHRCQVCFGAGYCMEFWASSRIRPHYSEPTCRRCELQEWGHGRDSFTPCCVCGGSGTNWMMGAFE